MAKSYFEQVAKILGVELREKFKLKNNKNIYPAVYYFTDDGLYIDNGDKKHALLSEILSGGCEIVKLPFKPCVGDIYWYAVGSLEHGCDYYSVAWTNNILDKQNFIVGNCFRTKEEVKAHKDEVISKLDELVKEKENEKTAI